GGDSGNSANGLNMDPVVNMCLDFLHGSDSEQWTHEFMHIHLVYASVCIWIGENIAKTSTMPHEASPRVTSLGGVGDTVKDSNKSADKKSDSIDEMANVLGTLGAANILASRGLRSVFTTASLSVATARTIVSHVVATASGSFPTAVIFTTASVATPTTRVTRYSRGVVIESSSPISINIPSISKKDKGKGKMTEPEQPNQIIREQAERDSEIARIYAERELEMMIIELNKSNKIVAKYLSKYEQAEAGLSHDENVELIDELLMYQRNLVQIKNLDLPKQILNAQTEPRKPENIKKEDVGVAEGSSDFTIEGYMENYKNVSQDIRNQLDAEAETSQELKTISYHKLYDILKQHQNKVNKFRVERLARTTNPLALVAQQQPTYHPQNHHNHHTQHFSTRSQQAATRNRGKAIVNSHLLTYDQEPKIVAKDDALSKEKEIDKLMALISLSFKKIYKPTNNNLRTSSNTTRAHQDNTLRINRGTWYDNQRIVNVDGGRENVAHYMYMAQIQEITPDAAHNSRPIFGTEPSQKVQNDDDNYNVFANDREHPNQSEYVNDTYLDEQGDTNVTIDLLDMSTNREMVDQDDDDLARERDLLASLIDNLKYEIYDNKNHNKLLESSNKTLVDKLKDKIEDFKTKNKSLE
nr:hypothetical protein [Tanacetum cinerariifolium]